MKKVFIYVLLFIFLCFLIPILCTKKESIKENKLINNDENQNEYDYGKYNSIKLLHTTTGEVEEIPLDIYLIGVVSSEMPANYEEEALKAQAIVARTYTLYNVLNESKHENADICDDAKCCQAWISKEERFNKWNEEEREKNWLKIERAVNSTKGKYVAYEGKPINAFFHSNSGGTTEIANAVWGGTNYPYLQSVETSGEDEYKQYSSEVLVSKDEFISRIKNYHSNFEINWDDQDQIKIIEYTEGKRIKIIKIGNLNLSGVEVRNIFGLKSANFEIKIEENDIRFLVIGYGHGVGMSQTGADKMAKEGKNYEEIIKHFYTNVEIIDIK